MTRREDDPGSGAGVIWRHRHDRLSRRSGKRSGASVGSIYHHFGGEDGIAAALYVEILREYQAGVVRAPWTSSRRRGWGKGARPVPPALGRAQPRAGALPSPERRRAGAGGEELKALNRELADAVGEWVERQPSIRSLRGEVFYAVGLRTVPGALALLAGRPDPVASPAGGRAGRGRLAGGPGRLTGLRSGRGAAYLVGVVGDFDPGFPPTRRRTRLWSTPPQCLA